MTFFHLRFVCDECGSTHGTQYGKEVICVNCKKRFKLKFGVE